MKENSVGQSVNIEYKSKYYTCNEVSLYRDDEVLNLISMDALYAGLTAGGGLLLIIGLMIGIEANLSKREDKPENI